MTRTSLAVVVALGFGSGACVDDAAPLGRGTAPLGVFDGNGDPCPKLGCGSNSAHVGPAEFHELDESRALANVEGFRIVRFDKGGVDYNLDVDGTTLRGWRRVGLNIVQIQGAGLVGARIVVEGPPAGTKYDIIIAGVTSQLMWQAPLTAIETYELGWMQSGTAGTVGRPVCVNPPNTKEGDGSQWASKVEAILFTGDRYDTTAKTVKSIGASPWFNIACAGTVMAKLALNRHTTVTETAAFPTTKDERQAMLKMYTSDVCGSGDAFTVTGTPLAWGATSGMHGPAASYVTNEAHWNQDGATCLDTHRLHGSPDDMDAQIRATCGTRVPRCSGSVAPYYLRTISPALP